MIKYFKGRISQGFVAIYSGRMILRIAGSLLGIFLPIFLYEIFGFELKYVIYYYLINYILYPLIIGWGAQYLNKIGLRRSLQINLFFGALFYVCFYFLDKIVVNTWLDPQVTDKVIILLILSLIVNTLWRTLYWTPLHTDIAKFTSKTNRGKQLSVMEATTVLLGAIMPLIAGWVISQYSYDVLFFIAILVYLFALMPFLHLPRTRERFGWSYLETWKEFFSKERRRVVLAYMGDGAEGVVGIVIWPIFMFELLNGNYVEVGLLSSLIVLATMMLQLIVGRFTDSGGKRRMLHIGSILYAIGWIVKIFIITAFQIFIASTYHSLVRIFSRTPFDALTYEKAADQGHFVDEFTVIHEIAISLGRVVMLLLVLLLIPFFSMQWTFLIAAMASLLMNFLTDEEAIEKSRV